MKRIFTKSVALLIGAMMCAAAMSCEYEKTISYDRLPSAAKSFVETYFSGVGVQRVEKEKDSGTKEYTVWLKDGTEIDFDSSGDWTSVETTFSAMPLGFLPSGVSAYIEANYSVDNVFGAEKEIGGYEVELSTTYSASVKLLFDYDGNFVRQYYDD